VKWCRKCSNRKPKDEFHWNRARYDGLQSYCKACMRSWALARARSNPERNKRISNAWYRRFPWKNTAKSNRRRARKLFATPRWLSKADYCSMNGQYEMASLMTWLVGAPYHVDHIVPLQGEAVCGLHVPWNLQVIRGAENLRKSNRLTY